MISKDEVLRAIKEYKYEKQITSNFNSYIDKVCEDLIKLIDKMEEK